MAAGAITGEQRLNIEVRLDTKGLKKGTAEYRKALLRMTKATKKANLAQSKLAGGAEKLRSNNRGASAAIIELGRGASDARFGFHGLGNNLERATELMGSLIKKNGGLKGAFKALGASLLGPAGLVVGITVLIAYGPAILKFFKNSFGDPAEVAKEKVMALTKELKTLRDDYFGATDTREADILRKWNEIIAAQEEYIRLLDESSKRSPIHAPSAGGVMVANDTRATLGDQQFADLQQTINKVAAEGDKAAIEAKKIEEEKLKIYKEQLKFYKDRENISKNNIKSGNEQYFKDNETGLFDAFDINPNEPVVVDVSDVIVLDESDYDLFGEWADKEVPKIDAAANKLGQALQTAMSSAFVGLGNAIGDALVGEGDFGDKFLKIIGGFMQAFGAAIIGVGIAALTLETALFSGQPWLAIGAGVALVAAGAVLSGIASKGVDGQGGGARSTPTATTTTPNSVQGAGGNGQLVATVRGQELRFLLQAADDSYGALS